MSPSSLPSIRRDFARLVTGGKDARLEDLFATIPREDFLPPGPWKLGGATLYEETQDADPSRVYCDTTVAIDPAKGINNGQPSLHAAWLMAVAPREGETVTQIGVGWGYYTAILSRLVGPSGQVEAVELDAGLAQEAQRRLAPYGNVRVTQGDATACEVCPSDVIYVSAGVVAPPVAWLRALKPGGRLIFPWRPAKSVGLTLLVTRHASGFGVRPLMVAWFIPCAGASATPDGAPLGQDAAKSIRSLWITDEQAPDETAVFASGGVWFSTRDVAA